jgi:hypothetical protein
MATLLIGYDLNKAGQDYSSLIPAIKALANGWWHGLDSTWLIKSALTPSQVCDKLREHLDANDELLVIDVTGDAHSWYGFGQKASDWLKDPF